MQPTLPTFFILGAQKAGTTWLNAVLKGHPEVGFGLRKEVHFFDDAARYALGADWYASQFSHNVGKKAIGDATPKYMRMGHPECYLHDPKIPLNTMDNFQRMFPNPKFIILLRDPVQRAISAYYMKLRNRKLIMGRSIFKAPPSQFLLSAGKYAEQLEIWFERYPRENFLILFYEESLTTADQRLATVQKVCEFLEVSTDYVPDNLNSPQNARPSDFDIYMKYFFGRFAKYFAQTPAWIKNSNIWKLEVSQSDLVAMHDYFQQPNMQLAELLGRDLPWK